MKDLRMRMDCRICGRQLSGFADMKDDPQVPWFVMPDDDESKFAVCEHHHGVRELYRETWKQHFGEYPEG